MQSDGASGVDLHSTETITIPCNETRLIPTGIALQIPRGFEGQVRSRSGLAIKYGVMVLNSPGTIDSDYRGEIKVILHNFGKDPFTISAGDRIAQLVICPVISTVYQLDELDETSRGAGGFGSTGI